jgi:hypothetical protein
MNREELKRLWFSLDYSNVKERKEIVVEIGKNPYWPGYGTVTITSDGPDGYFSFSTHQEHPVQYAKDRMSEGFDGLRDLSKYELIIK